MGSGGILEFCSVAGDVILQATIRFFGMERSFPNIDFNYSLNYFTVLDMLFAQPFHVHRVIYIPS